MKMFECKICGNFYVKTSGNQKYCVNCRKDANKNKVKNFINKRRLKIFNHYGGALCKLCGENDIRVLVIDHIKGKGTEHRRKLTDYKGNYDGQSIYRWIVKNNFPKGFQVLCRNCNWRKRLENGEN